MTTPLGTNASTLNSLQAYALLIARIGLLGMAVSMPISRAVFNLSAALMITGWLLSGNWQIKYQIVASSRVALASFAFFALCAASLLWVPHIGPDQWDALRGYSRLLYVPIILTLLNDATWLRRAWRALLAGMLLVLSAYVVDIWFEIPGSESYGTHTAGQGVFYHHIAQGMVLSFLGAYALHRGWESAHLPKQRWLWWAVAATTAAGMLTVGQSRTGQLSVVVAYVVVAFGHTNMQTRVWSVLAIALAASILVAVSPRTQDRLHLGLKEASSFQQDGQHTSVGARLQAWSFSWHQIKQSPWLGHGIGTYREKAYGQFEGSPICRLGVCEQPHNQFVVSAFEMGLVGLVALMCLLVAPFPRDAKQAHMPSRMLAAAFVAVVATTALFDSSLKIQAQLFFVVTALGLLGCTSPSACRRGQATTPP